MTQEELKLVLDALKWCHGGEPCGTAEAIAVVERALANVATNDIPKKHVDEMQKQRHEQEPVAWEAPQGHGIKRFISQSLYEKFSPEIRKWYKPYKCPSCEADLTQRTWVGLTDEEIDYIYTGIRAVHHDVDSDVLCRAIEAKLKEKNT